MKYSRAARAACCEPRLAGATDRQATVARGERSFVGDRRGRLLAMPACAAVAGGQDHEMPVDGIAHHDAVIRIPERKCVEETLRVGIRVQRCPALAAVGGFIDARFFAAADAQQVSSALVNRMNRAKVE